MCTVSWKYQNQGYDLFFNRDELNSREIAHPPTVHLVDGVRCIAPIDRNANGTWLAVNEYGVTIFLLNHYPGDSAKTAPPQQSTRTRGDIVLHLMSILTKADLEAALDSLRVSEFAPFRLGMLFPGALPVTWVWNGEDFTHEGEAETFFTSSSYRSSEVELQRMQTMANLETRTIQDFLGLHKSHIPEKSAYSICMHRDNAQTVSFSHISVRETSISFAYADGPPCSTELNHRVELIPTREIIFDIPQHQVA